MKIRTKITLFTSGFLALMVIVITYFSVMNVKNQGEQRLLAYRSEAINDIKGHLKNLVEVAYETIDNNYNNLSDVEYLKVIYNQRLQNIIDTGENIINRNKRLVKQGKLTLSAAKINAMSEIKKLRFDNGTGYIWINDIAEPYPRMVMHPTVPALDGTVLDDLKYNNALGVRKNLFQAFIDVTRNSNDGYVDYRWPKPTKNGLTKEVPKLSYVRRYNDWGWILGTGIYLDDARVDVEAQIKRTIKSMRYADGTGYFWINDNAVPYPRMVMHPTVPALDGEVLDDPKYNNAQGVDKNLFQAFVEVTSEEGDGFVDYLWPKPTQHGLTERVPKISYVKLHEPTGWIIGSGTYIDNIDEIVSTKKLEIERQAKDLMRDNIIISSVFIAVVVVVSFLFASTLATPIKNLTQVALQISKGKNMSQIIKEVNRKDEIGELAKSVDRLKTSVTIMLNRM